MGTGYRVRTMHEPILVCTVGNPRHLPFPSFFNGLAREHSRKPDEFCDLIVKHTPHAVRRADLFSRETRGGFDGWGDQLGKFDNAGILREDGAQPHPPIGASIRAARVAAMKLRLIRPQIPTVGSPIEALTKARYDRDRELERDARRRAEQPHRRLYHTAEWKELRAAQLKRFQWCEICASKSPPQRTQADTVHHRRAHKGDLSLFFNPANLQSVCANCHNSEIQAGERAGNYVTPIELAGIAVPANLLTPIVLKPSLVPLTIVSGPPGAGKSTLVNERAQPGDLVIDLDQIIDAMSRTEMRTRKRLELYLADALAERNRMLGRLATNSDGVRAAWLIITAAAGTERQRWARRLGAARTFVLLTDATECIRRINADPRRADDMRRHLMGAVHHWWDTYSPSNVDEAP